MGHIGDKYDQTGDKATAMVTPLLQRMSYTGEVNLVETGSQLVVPLQRIGVDCLVWTSPGEVYAIEVKGRDKAYDDIWVEEIQDGEQGWVKTLRCDYLAYVLIPSWTAHLVEWAPFLTWYTDVSHDYDQRTHHKSDNRYSVGTIIPWSDIQAELGDQQYQQFNLYRPSTWDGKLQDMGLIEAPAISC